jgi:cupin fold WbuC family metalloprotein
MTTRLALDPPASAATPITEEMLDQARDASRESPRGRIIFPLQKTADAPLQRMFNAMQPGSYVQPHCHDVTPKPETVIVLRGSIAYFVFDDQGAVTNTIIAKAGSPTFGIDSTPNVWHTFFALEPDTVVFECKPGPYNPTTDKRFAPWAPPEGSPEADTLLAQLKARLSSSERPQ